MKNKISIDIFSDTICPWCYIGKRKLQSVMSNFSDCQFNITWRPYQINPHIPLEGIDRTTYLNKKFGGQTQASHIYNSIYMAGKKAGIYFQFNKIKTTPNTLASHKLLALAHKHGKQNEIIESLFYSYFIEGKNIGKLKELIVIANQHDLNEHEVNNYLISTKDTKGLLEESVQARQMGVKGVPSFIINKKFVVFGVQTKDKFFDLINSFIN